MSRCDACHSYLELYHALLMLGFEPGTSSSRSLRAREESQRLANATL